MSDLFIIVTRMTGKGENEFNGYFNNRNWAAKYNQNTTCRIPTEQADLLYDNKDSILFVNGSSVKNHDGKCKALKQYISSGNERNIYMLIHPGVDLTLEQANQRIFKCNNAERESIPQKLEIQEYSSKFTFIKGIVEHLAKCINENNPGTICQTDKIKDYIRKKEREPIVHLFLPLDIDMQALGILLNEKKDSKKTGEYLKEMLADSKEYHKRILGESVQLFEQISNEKKKAGVQASVDELKDFLGTLNELRSDMILDFNDDQSRKLEEDIKNFHNWYGALAECLRE
jgi:hypothetical protein